ncbi:hypothetical protein AN189_17475 [Loktanella sp. 3ANDIMAR09]|uniref:hypothetical protein n=1 Tax=Loktanella sp. 3ANDIMAR09 TaxID=1225657 RepID=UPI0006FC74B5|nr:hypothetical protein [Loktanella sp. 3ANDIMAR09]KQI67016.1 hypothetical protein AN189_17475 [Loktanella sp. 3ANDIMAR09]
MDVRDWRDAKPKWAIDAAKSELEQWQITAALSWPQEAKPEPVPFQWGDYDNLHGEPVEGVYWTATHGVRRVEIREKNETDVGWKKWRFKIGDGQWSSSVTRGPLYPTQRDAFLALVWAECENAAKRLHTFKGMLRVATEVTQ